MAERAAQNIGNMRVELNALPNVPGNAFPRRDVHRRGDRKVGQHGRAFARARGCANGRQLVWFGVAIDDDFVADFGCAPGAKVDWPYRKK